MVQGTGRKGIAVQALNRASFPSNDGDNESLNGFQDQKTFFMHGMCSQQLIQGRSYMSPLICESRGFRKPQTLMIETSPELTNFWCERLGPHVAIDITDAACGTPQQSSKAGLESFC